MYNINRRLIRTAALALALIMALAVFTGCQATITNPVVGKVGNEEITYSQFYSMFTTYKQYQSYGMLASDSTKSDTEQLQELKDMVWDALISSAVVLDQAKKQGITLDDDEKATVETDLQSQLDSAIAEYLPDGVSEDDAKYDEYLAEAKKELTAELKDNGYTYDKYVEAVRDGLTDQALSDKLTAQIKATAVVTDEQVQQTYDTALSNAQEAYAGDVSLYYEDYTTASYYGGVPPVFVPEGYYYVKHILILNPEEGEEKDVDGIVAEIEQKLANGEDFDALMNEYSEDTGLASNPDGYMFNESISDKYYAEFSDAAAKLEKKGDMSEPVKSSAGTHILMRGDDIESRIVPLDEVRDAIYAQLLNTAQNDALDAATEEWTAATNIVKYEKRVQYVGVS